MNRTELYGVDAGAWWSTDGRHEIDIVGVAANRKPTFAGSVKWRDAELGKAVLTSLDEGIAAVATLCRAQRFVRPSARFNDRILAESSVEAAFTWYHRFSRLNVIERSHMCFAASFRGYTRAA